jgi:hypothetical protein
MRMGRRFVIAGMLAVITLAACSDTNAPATSRIATIYQINVPEHAAFSDTVRVSFSYSIAGCDTGVVVEQRPTVDGMRFTVRSKPTNQVCPMTLTESFAPIIVPPVGVVIAPPHIAPMKLVFTQPEGGDSVRIISP